MILTVTLNVAVDKRYVVEGIDIGSVMRVKESSQSAGGKGINVAKIAKQLGADVIATGIVGGHTGAYIISELEKRNINTDFLKVKNDSRTSVNVFDSVNGTHSQFLESGGLISKEEYSQFLDKYRVLVDKSDIICICGSTPPGAPQNCYSQMISVAKEKGKKVFLDASGELLADGIKSCPALIKPNIDEIIGLGFVKSNDINEIEKAARELFNGGIEYVLVSLGEDGALLVCKDGTFKGKTAKVPVVNTVGCGDSMLSSFAVAIQKGMTSQEALEVSLAVATANALSEGAGEYREDDLRYLLDKVSVERIK